ncbi:hypothetical protein VFPBJ_04501 [Purpureocillium lilacinum]|uniref:Uncharacterized protein n=1 Tax=Purpureocillium lilacinum TaxID=33203 RepID=A0A179GVD8_PURLI|nr:hypothetical protein VFPBJ_04501 [Purpureocillium lilacinum]
MPRTPGPRSTALRAGPRLIVPRQKAHRVEGLGRVPGSSPAPSPLSERCIHGWIHDPWHAGADTPSPCLASVDRQAPGPRMPQRCRVCVSPLSSSKAMHLSRWGMRARTRLGRVGWRESVDTSPHRCTCTWSA